MTFLHPHLLWGAPAILILGVALYLWSRRVRRRRLALFTTHAGTAALLRSPQETLRAAGHGLVVLGALLIVVALARPLTGPVAATAEREGIDVLVALDVSKSMLAPDLPPYRLEAARAALLPWLRARSGDRVGLILFAGDAFLQMPLSLDHQTVAGMVQAARPTGRGGSNLENPIQTAIDVFARSEGKSRALLLVTDGENHEGDPAARAAEALRAHAIRVYTLGVGTLAGGKVPHTVRDGLPGGEVRNSYGVGVTSRLDATRLRAIAAAGGGAYYSLADSPDALAALQSEHLGKLLRDTREIDAADYREWFAAPLLAALLCLLGERLLPRLGASRKAALAALLLLAGLASPPPARAQEPAPDFSVHRQLVRDGRPDEAAGQLRELARLRPEDPYPLYNLGVAEYSAKNYKAAAEAFETLLALPGDTLRARALVQLGNARVRLAEAALAAGNEALASTQFELALQSYENPAADGRAAAKNARLAETVYLDSLEKVAREQFAHAEKITDNWTQRRVLQKSLGALGQLLARDPARAPALALDIRARRLLVGNLVDAGRLKLRQAQGGIAAKRYKDAFVPLRDANDLADAALAASPDDPRARDFHQESRTAFAAMLVQQGREEFAEAMQMAKLSTRLGKLGSAEQRLVDALGHDPANPDAPPLLAEVRAEIEKTAVADGDALVAAADKATGPAGISINLTQAISRYQRALEVNPGNAHAQARLAAIVPRLAEALLLMAQNELDAARRLVADKPRPTAADIRAALDRLGKADEALSKAAANGMDDARITPVAEETRALAEKLMRMLEEMAGGAPPPPPPPAAGEKKEGEPGEAQDKPKGEGEPQPGRPKTFADIRKTSKGGKNPPPAKDW